jgi:hypothetical protein
MEALGETIKREAVLLSYQEWQRLSQVPSFGRLGGRSRLLRFRGLVRAHYLIKGAYHV